MESCKVCKHPQLRMVDEMIKGGAALAVVGRQFDLPEDSLSRHRRHVDQIEAEESGASVGELLVSLQAARQMASEIMLGAGDAELRLTAAREVRQVSESIAKLTGVGKMDPRHAIPFWSKLKTAILSALKRHPAAREDVLLAIESVMGDDV